MSTPHECALPGRQWCLSCPSDRDRRSCCAATTTRDDGHKCDPNRCCNHCRRHLVPHVMNFDANLAPIFCDTDDEPVSHEAATSGEEASKA